MPRLVDLIAAARIIHYTTGELSLQPGCCAEDGQLHHLQSKYRTVRDSQNTVCMREAGLALHLQQLGKTWPTTMTGYGVRDLQTAVRLRLGSVDPHTIGIPFMDIRWRDTKFGKPMRALPIGARASLLISATGARHKQASARRSAWAVTFSTARLSFASLSAAATISTEVSESRRVEAATSSCPRVRTTPGIR